MKDRKYPVVLRSGSQVIFSSDRGYGTSKYSVIVKSSSGVKQTYKVGYTSEDFDKVHAECVKEFLKELDWTGVWSQADIGKGEKFVYVCSDK